jgi:hypothetical protein
MRQIGGRMMRERVPVMREPVRETRAAFLAMRERLFVSRPRLPVMHEEPLVTHGAAFLARERWRAIRP